MPTIIELSLAKFKSAQVKKASEDLISFLSDNPQPNKVLQYKISNKSQTRVFTILAANGERMLNQSEENELDEWVKFNSSGQMLLIMAKKLTK